MTADLKLRIDSPSFALLTTEEDPVTYLQFKSIASGALNLIANNNRLRGRLDLTNLRRDGASLISDFPKNFDFEAYVLTLKPEDHKLNSRIYHLLVSDEVEKSKTRHSLFDFTQRNVNFSEELIWKDIIDTLTKFT